MVAASGKKNDGKRAKGAGKTGKKARNNRKEHPTGVVFAVPPQARTETVEELRARARRLGLTGYYRLRKADLLERLQEGEPVPRA